MRRAGGMADDIWWLNIYVMLSRARKLDNLILAGLTPQIKEMLEAGPPAYIREKIKARQAKAALSMRKAERLANEMGLTLPSAARS